MSQLEDKLATKADIKLLQADIHKEFSSLKTTLFTSLVVFFAILTVIISLFIFPRG